ncbi:MAG: hypothetical protein Q7S22_03080 [Candidatus Micrarchaeota archaeon]|nr:hypothetical protein [Candidatus Micrarchaeota archaeon]
MKKTQNRKCNGLPPNNGFGCQNGLPEGLLKSKTVVSESEVSRPISSDKTEILRKLLMARDNPDKLFSLANSYNDPLVTIKVMEMLEEFIRKKVGRTVELNKPMKPEVLICLSEYLNLSSLGETVIVQLRELAKTDSRAMDILKAKFLPDLFRSRVYLDEMGALLGDLFPPR